MADLFAGLPVSNYAAARPWYERFFGSEPFMEPHDTECVWELGEHRYVYIVEDAERAGGGLVTLFFEADEFESTITAIRERGIEPTTEETYSNGVRKTTFHDAEGNEIGYGGPPVSS